MTSCGTAHVLPAPVLAAAALAAESSDWNQLSRLKPGTNVQVVQANKLSIEGEFVSYSDSEITLKAAGGDFSIQKDRVVRVSARPPGRRKRNALIGTGIAGGAGGVLAALAIYGVEGFSPGTAVGMTAGFAGIGAAIGAAIRPGLATVYRVKQLPAQEKK